MSVIQLETLQAELGTLTGAQTGGFTIVNLTGSFAQIAAGLPGAASAGTVTITPIMPMSNGGVTIAVAPLSIEIDATGSFSVQLPATDDDLTVPSGVVYAITERIVGAAPWDYCITLPNATLQADLADLRPGETGWL